jgi:hypothetical protein
MFKLEKIDIDSKIYAAEVWRLIQANPERYLSQLSREEASRELKALTQDKFMDYVDTMYTAHRSVRHGFEEVGWVGGLSMIVNKALLRKINVNFKHAPTWDFMNSLFFTATMLTSIGFGWLVGFLYNFPIRISSPCTLKTVLLSIFPMKIARQPLNLGYLCPITFEGRLFGILYCLIGG